MPIKNKASLRKRVASAIAAVQPGYPVGHVGFLADNAADAALSALGRHLEGLLNNAVQIDGSHHKQWFLEEIASELGVTLDDHDAGVMP